MAAFDSSGYRPRDEDVDGPDARPITLHGDRTLFLFVFVASGTDWPVTPQAQMALLRDLYGHGGWECGKILSQLEEADELYFDSVSQIRLPNRACGRCGLLRLIVAGQGSALPTMAAYVLAGELSASEGRDPPAFANYEARLRSYIASKQRDAPTLCRGVCAQNSGRDLFSQHGDKSLRHSGSCKVRDRQGHRRSHRASRLSLACPRSIGGRLIPVFSGIAAAAFCSVVGTSQPLG